MIGSDMCSLYGRAMPVNVKNVIRYVTDSDLDDGRLIQDPELNSMLDAFRTTYPKKFKCRRDRCGNTLGFWAFFGQEARVVPGPARRSKKDRIAGTSTAEEGGTSVIGGEVDLLFPDFQHQERFDVAIEWAMRGDGVIRLATNPEIGSGWPLRWDFVCPSCGAEYTYTNREMLLKFLRAVYAHRDSI